MPNTEARLQRPPRSGPVGAPPLVPSNFGSLAVDRSWRRSWTHVVAGRFLDTPYYSLFFYEQSAGRANFYTTDGTGGLSLACELTGLPKTWTHIISGAFYRPDRSGLLFYDQAAGYAAVYDVDATGALVNVREHAGWRPSWTHITTIRVPDGRGVRNSDYSGVLLYDRAAGHGEVHRCVGAGTLELIVREDGWRTSWTAVVGDANAGTGVLFYEGTTLHGEVYAVSYDATHDVFGFDQQAVAENLPSATSIIPGNFGWVDTSFVFYDRTAGRAAFVFFNPPSAEADASVVVGEEAYDNWPTSWDIIVPGNFWEPDPEYVQFQNGFTDLLVYDRAHGYTEIFFHEPYGAVLSEPLEGYASPGSVVAGETINIYVNSQVAVGPYTLTILRQDLTEVLMTSIQNIQQFPQPFPIERLDYRDGPAWPPVAELVIPNGWPSGLYLARAEADGFEPLTIPFVVRAKNPGTQSKILLLVPDATYEAYNFWGGRSLYGFRSHAGAGYAAPVWSYGPSLDPWPKHQLPRAFRVSLARPYNDDLSIPKWQKWEVPFLKWLARQGIAVELCTATDLHKDQAHHADFLGNYRLLVAVGHHEYWTKEMRDNVETFAANGGNVTFFGGNVCWFQVRLDLSASRVICYKDRAFDPYTDLHPHLSTVNWYDTPVCRPETTLTGVSWYGAVNPQPVFKVRQPNHWVFEGLDASSKVEFGLYVVPGEESPRTVLTGETDKYQPPQLIPQPCLPSSPSNFQTLAEAMAIASPHVTAGTMGVFVNGSGHVFTAATVDWPLALSQDDSSWNAMDQITKNVLTHLG